MEKKDKRLSHPGTKGLPVVFSSSEKQKERIDIPDKKDRIYINFITKNIKTINIK